MAVRTPDPHLVAKTLAILKSAENPSEPQLREALKFSALRSELDRWQFWTLICLSRHVLRQNWVGYIVETRLTADLRLLGRAGAMGHPDGIPQHGDVPDEKGWRYFFHGCGCCLTHKEDGICIDVDFTDEGASDRIDRFFYSRFLEELRRPELPERLLQRKEPFQHAWQAEIESLAQSGCIVATRGLQMTEVGKGLTESFAPVVDVMIDLSDAQTIPERRRFLLGALSLGDFLLAENVAADLGLEESLKAEIVKAAEHEKEERSERLAHVIRKSSATSDSSALTALADLGSRYSKATITDSLFRDPVDGISNQALAILVNWDEAGFVECLERLINIRSNESSGFRLIKKALFGRPTKPDALPREYQIVHAATALLQRSAHDAIKPKLRLKLVSLLESAVGANSGEAALLLYFLDQRRGLDRLTASLSGKIPAARKDAAAACVLIGNSQAKEILANALGNPNLQIQHAAACALKRFPSPEARQLAAEWWARSDGIDSPQGKEVTIGGKTITAFPMNEVMHANMEMFFEASLERLRKKFGPIAAHAS